MLTDLEVYMNFRKITLEDKTIIDSFLSRYECNASTYSMAYLASWRYFDFDNMCIWYDESALVLRFVHKGITHYLAELTSRERFPHIVDEILTNDPIGIIVQVEGEYADTVDNTKYRIVNREVEAEYLYMPSDLITLSGKRYHGKRNHVKRFERLYPHYVYRDYQPSDRERVLALYDEWEEDKSPDMLRDLTNERIVIEKMLDNMHTFGLFGAVIEVDDVLVGYTIGEVTASNIGIVHIEKGNTDYEGIYPTINMLFAREHFAGVRYINRQEDMGIEGLRRAKRSYYPVKMSEKCSIENN